MANQPPYQIVAFFHDLDGRGWSEKYYTSQNLTQSQADAFRDAYLPLRMALSTTSIFCDHIRIGTNVTRSPFVYYPDINGPGMGTLPGPTSPSDNAILCALYSTSRYKNNVFLRGVPESIIALEEKVPDSTWDGNFAAFVGGMLGVGFLCVKTVLGTTYPPKTIVTLTHGTPKGLRLTIPLTDTLTEGDVIRIHNVSIPGYNGLKTVVKSVGVVGGGNLYLLGGANPISDPPAVDNSFYTARTIQSPSLSDIQIERVSNRKTGRPFVLPRGRARTTFSLRP